MPLLIYTASAGSGKTYLLAYTYIRLVLSADDPMRFTRILAVTFTNKATEEMKSRILKYLKQLHGGDPETASMLVALQRDTGLGPETLRRKAGEVLHALLNHYDRFSVSTLDSFFQKIIHAFVFETGLSPDFILEIDESAILERAVDHLIDRVQEYASLKRWLMDYVDSHTEKARPVDFRSALIAQSSEVLKESFKLLGPAFHKQLADHAAMEALCTALKNLRGNFTDTMKRYGKKGLAVMSRYGLEYSQYRNGERSFASYFARIASPDKNTSYVVRDSFRRALQDETLFASKTSPDRDRILASAGELMPLMQETVEFFDANYPLFVFADEILDSMPSLRLFADIIRQMELLQQQTGHIYISNTLYLLRQLVSETDSPFIYEKAGNLYTSFLLDEFQDTSVMQWESIRPLLENALSQNYESLIVGDVKQAIYRWRNSDWRILSEGVQRDLSRFPIENNRLEFNYRSREEIVRFVNACIRPMLTEAENILQFPESFLETAYKDYEQTIAQHRMASARGGYVQLALVSAKKGEEKDADTLILEQLPGILESVQSRGYALSDCMILVQKNKEAQQVVKHLLAYGREHPHTGYAYDAVSDDSLLLKESPYINLCIALWKAAVLPDDVINAALIDELLAVLQLSKPEGLLQTLACNNLSHSLEYIVQALSWQSCREALPYLQEFYDLVLDFSRNQSNSIYAFLQWWEEYGDTQKLKAENTGNAVRVITIHSAKGLEAPVVILPFVNWTLDHRAGQSPLLWVPAEEPFKYLDYYPLRYRKSLESTPYASRYREEKALNFLEKLNLFYVAVTRPAEELYLFVNKNNDSMPSVGKLLEDIWFGKKTEASDNSAPRRVQYRRFGEPGRCTDQKPQPIKTCLFETLPSAPFRDKLRVAFREAPFVFSPDNSQRQWGLLLHDAFSGIETLDQLPAVFDALRRRAVLYESLDTLEAYLEKIRIAFANPRVASWFDGSWKVFNESTLLFPDRPRLRPDRVMFGEGQTLVIDYKFGEKHRAEYKSQMDAYVRNLQKMGYPQVSAHIWYVLDNEIE